MREWSVVGACAKSERRDVGRSAVLEEGGDNICAEDDEEDVISDSEKSSSSSVCSESTLSGESSGHSLPTVFKMC